MGSFSLLHIAVVAVFALLLFGGRGKISDLMGDVAKGIHSFRKGLKDGDEQPAAPAPRITVDDKDPVQR